MTTPLTRRRTLAGLTGVGLALPVLAACGDDSGSTASDTPSGTPTSDPTTDATSGSAPATGEASSPASSAAPVDGIVSTADVPVGSGVILADDQVVVTQPTEGDIKVFSAICTHSGCPVGAIKGAVITCPCHGSTFDAATGAVLGGPASAPLPAVDFTLDGDQVVLS
ncbi:Rieske (2Fe-2S) protein [Nocardioides plantarum]|uniref:Cytochrome bc1 complex Rieske iron-sulfur subunit n=1 Tax=Nocardioides plantarum TaxID=29299 RepID=A0ABV5K5V9_9ACTN|nr:Rieske (2Fe-2S) protein [Nocardioides plantarum]